MNAGFTRRAFYVGERTDKHEPCLMQGSRSKNGWRYALQIAGAAGIQPHEVLVDIPPVPAKCPLVCG